MALAGRLRRGQEIKLDRVRGELRQRLGLQDLGDYMRIRTHATLDRERQEDCDGIRTGRAGVGIAEMIHKVPGPRRARGPHHDGVGVTPDRRLQLLLEGPHL